ncbi:N-terminal phage integrase SAM-like domain-containing protein [Enterococcus rivorum]|nr:N-terminal phage integrase SAM-like domain-containing protein [Enterococcus rivorum]MBP2100477.1 hypothetical protein [Enterococcus rivorum]
MTDFKDGKLDANKVKTTSFKMLYQECLNHHRLEVKVSTVATNRRFVENHVLPVLGSYKIDKITVSQCKKIVDGWQKEYKQFKYLRLVTAQILQYAIRMEYLQSNPMKNTVPPKTNTVKKRIFIQKNS